LKLHLRKSFLWMLQHLPLVVFCREKVWLNFDRYRFWHGSSIRYDSRQPKPASRGDR